jgi:putative endonuclease
MKTSLNTSKGTHLDLGKIGETYAAAHLEQHGYVLVAANFTLPVGRNRRDAIVTAELDLVAYDGPVLCFVEVKTRKSEWFAPAEANVDRHKRRQIARAAREYRHLFAIQDEPFRYDVVTVVLAEETTTPQIELFKNFWREEQLKMKPRFERFYD